MRHHLGLGIGHTYSGHTATTSSSGLQATHTLVDCSDETIDVDLAPLDHPPNDANDSDGDDPELGFANREDDLGEAEEGSEGEFDHGDRDDEELIAINSTAVEKLLREISLVTTVVRAFP
jgi:hypothetical protein